MADVGAGPAQRADLHPPVHPRRPGLPRDDAALLRASAAAPRQPRVVLRGRANAHRQAPAAQDGGAPLPGGRLRGQRRPGRRRIPGAGGDRLRPAGRGRGAVLRGGRRHQGSGEPALAGRVRSGAVAAARAGAPALRLPAVAAVGDRRGAGAGRLGGADRGGAAGGLRGGPPDQRRDTDHARGAGDLRPARQRRPGPDPGRDPRRDRAAGRVGAPARAAADERRRPGPAGRPVPCAADAGARGRRRGVRRRAGAGLRHRAEPPARGGVLSQHRDPLLHQPRHRRGRRRPRRRGGGEQRHPRHVDALAGPARPAEVRVLLPDQAHVLRGAGRRGRDGQARLGGGPRHPRGRDRGAGRLAGADRPSGDRPVPGGVRRRRRPAGRPRAGRADRRGLPDLGVPRRGPAADAPAAAAQPRVDQQGRDERLSQARRQPRAARTGRRRAAQGAGGLRGRAGRRGRTRWR